MQEIAAHRKETLVGHLSIFNEITGLGKRPMDGKPYGGYYTQVEVKEIVAYALKRHITVIPEIELPGHSTAALAAYPELGCTGEKIEVATTWGIYPNVYCPKENTFDFLEDVLDEVLELFPSKYIHIGGDEAPKKNWKKCDHCQKLIKEKGLKNEKGLQSYFITRIEKYLNNKGRNIIGWDEILEGGLAPNATVMSWRGIKGAIKSAKQNHNVIMTPTSHCYFDYYQFKGKDKTQPIAYGRYLPLKKVYHFNPIPNELTLEERKYVLGAQVNLWTEYVKTPEQVEFMTFPRIAALSEAIWSENKNKNYNYFTSRLAKFNNRLQLLQVNVAKKRTVK